MQSPRAGVMGFQGMGQALATPGAVEYQMHCTGANTGVQMHVVAAMPSLRVATQTLAGQRG
jgi:hypothetical protein